MSLRKHAAYIEKLALGGWGSEPSLGRTRTFGRREAIKAQIAPRKPIQLTDAQEVGSKQYLHDAVRSPKGSPQRTQAVAHGTRQFLKGAAAVNVDGIKQWASKHRDALKHGTEIAGLGVLAAPSVAELRRKKTEPEDPEVEEKRRRRHAKAEIAGLGILAAPSAIDLAKHVMKKTSSADLRSYSRGMFKTAARLEALAQMVLEKEAGILRTRPALTPPAAATATRAADAAARVRASGVVPHMQNVGGFQDPAFSHAAQQRAALRADLHNDLQKGRLTGLDRLKAIRTQHPGGTW